MLDYYARRWTIEVYFRDCKQLLGLGKGQSEIFDAVVAWVSIVMIRYLLLVYILAKRQTAGPIGPLFRQLTYEHLQIALIQTLWTRIRQIFMLSSQLIWPDSESGKISYLLDLIEESILDHTLESSAKL
ncbi:MAG: transposase [Thermodesulfobacteriota bacterium]